MSPALTRAGVSGLLDRIAFAALLLGGAWLIPLQQAAWAQQAPLKAPLSAEVRFSGADGAPLTQILPEQAFDVVLQIRSQMGAVPGDLRPMAWLRDRGPSDLPCGETAAAYRAAGRASIGSVDLNGVVLGVVMEDGSVVIFDPERALGTANLLTARRADPPPTGLVADPLSGQFVLSLPGKGAGAGRVVALSPYGHSVLLAEGLDRPGPPVAAVTGGVWLAELGSGDLLRVGRSGAPRRFELGARQIAGDAGSEPTQRLAALSDDRLTVLEDDGRIALQVPAPAARAAGLSAQAALWLDGESLHVIWLDAPAQPLTIPLAGDFDRLAVSPEGRMVYLFARDRTGFGIVDLALGRMVQGADTDSPVAEIAFLPGAAMLRLADQSAVGVMDLREIDPQAEAVVGRVTLGERNPAPASEATLLAPLLPEPALLAVHPQSYTGFVVNSAHAASGKPPMEAMRLRGGIPRHVRALDRSLRQTAPGIFTAAARLPRPGNWELVVSVGVGQLAFCAPLPTPPAPPASTAEGRIDALPLTDGRLRLRFVGQDGRPAAGLTGVLELAALTGNWRARQTFVTDAEGLTADSYDLRARLPLVVTTRGAARDDKAAGFAPLVLEEIR